MHTLLPEALPLQAQPPPQLSLGDMIDFHDAFAQLTFDFLPYSTNTKKVSKF
jgi:hypothetical protein